MRKTRRKAHKITSAKYSAYFVILSYWQATKFSHESKTFQTILQLKKLYYA